MIYGNRIDESGRALTRLALLCGILAFECTLIVLAFQILTPLDCHDTGMYFGCRALRLSVAQALCIAVGLALYLGARPDGRRTLREITAPRQDAGRWAALHGLGLAVIFVPVAILPPAAFAGSFATILPLLLLGAFCVVTGALFWLAPPRAIGQWARAQGRALPGIVTMALILPPVADRAALLWNWGPLARATFASVAWVLSHLVQDITVLPDRAIIGADGFLVAVASQCSGIEGLALMAAFLAVYAALFRDTLRQARFWAVVFPLALLASLFFNILRIATLILIGASGSPELAVNGFHSFAGWLSFTFLVLLVLIVTHRLAWLQKDLPARPASAVLDHAVERILPFVVFMIGSVALNAAYLEPTRGYPLLAAALAAALWVSRTAWLGLDWRLDPLVIVMGAAVALVWIITAPAADAPSDWLVALGPVAAMSWIATRLIGTIILVPLVEELFFRGYVQARIDNGGLLRRACAIALSAGLFAALHDRWAVAATAGIVFSLLFLKRGRLSDAIVAHMIANAGIAAVAVARGDWSLI